MTRDSLGDVSLKVIDVLKGTAQRGQLLTAKLEHLYTVEASHVGWDALVKRDMPPDGVPKLCYKQQLMNPGDLVPLPLLEDGANQRFTFFPARLHRRLKKLGQIQSVQQQLGWQQALDGRPINLLFRLTQGINTDLARDALEELGKTGDPACLDQLFAWLVNPDLRQQFRAFQSTPILATPRRQIGRCL